MISKVFTPIDRQATQQTFFDYTEALDIPEIDYIAIGMQCMATKQSTSIMSNSEWQSHFIKQNYAPYDPLRLTALNTERTLIPFKSLESQTKLGKTIMEERARMGIKDGIMIVARQEQFNYVITLGTGYNSFDPYDFLVHYRKNLPAIQSDLISLIAKDADTFSSSQQR